MANTLQSASSGHKSLSVSVVSISALDKETIEQMWQIFDTYYLDVDRARFETDLLAKNDVFLLRDADNLTLQGFSTVRVFEERINNRKCVAIYSGDTIIRREYWGQTALQKAFYLYITRVFLANPFTPVYWFLISKGYKTYLLLSRNFPDYWPSHRAETPAFENALIDRLSQKMFGDSWKPDLGVLKFDTPMGKLKGEVAPITESMCQHADIKYFIEKNPGHGHGDELCCLGKVDLSLALHYPAKLLKKRPSLSQIVGWLPWPVRS
jgi:hypothetical protein